ncbi:MAG: zinc-ribbon domain-containing protein [Bacteroidota bacterium]
MCGWPVGQKDHDMQSFDKAPTASTDAALKQFVASASASAVAESGPFCHMCGWQNPVGAKFCSACGTELQVRAEASKPVAPAVAEQAELPPEVKESPLPAAEDPPLNMANVGMLVVAGILVVAVLFMITRYSWRAFPEVEPAPAQAQTSAPESNPQRQAPEAAIAGELANQIAALEAEAASLDGDALVAKNQELIQAYIVARRPDKAAPVQEEIATLTNSAEDWFSAGHFYYDWMDTLRGEARFAAASQATAAYEKGLAVSPDNLDIRTALAMAYLNTRAPMQGVTQIRQVLDTDPNHLQGNFYYGVMLMQINRLDQAKTQFEKVKTLVGADSPVYQQADQMLQNLNR